jgi:hypothetical protein
VALPPAVDLRVPYVTSHRRYLWLAQRRATREDSGTEAGLRGRKLEVVGTALPASFPSRTVLLAAGVLAVEEVVGADVPELRSYGLSAPAAERLILWLERLTMTSFNYGPRVGQAYEEDEVELVASGARTASFTSDVYEVGDKGTLRLSLALSAISGTGASLHAQVETREAYGSGTWRVVDAFGPLTAAGTTVRSMSGLDRFVRVVCTIGGSSPSVTFALTGTAV